MPQKVNQQSILYIESDYSSKILIESSYVCDKAFGEMHLPQVTVVGCQNGLV